MASLSQLVGRPTEKSVTLSVLAASAQDAFVEYGPGAGPLSRKTPTQSLKPGVPFEFEIEGLAPDTSYTYRLRTRGKGATDFAAGPESSFRSRRKSGEGFVFCVQGDSHPERAGKMYDADLYVRTLQNVASDKPDFYFLMGDDFSIERLIERGTKRQDAVDAVYESQRGFLGIVGRSTPLMLVNGNHEQAAKYLLDGTADNFAVLAGRARTTFFPLPAPSKSGPPGMYSGNPEIVPHIGQLRDYYAWEWGDALFVVIDPYWHSDVAVDNEAGVKAPAKDGNPPAGREGKGGGKGGGRGQRDLWQITLGDEQYRWLRTTLTESKAKFKFVFSHHVLGTGRGGVEQAGFYEWGGEDRRGIDRFKSMRPTWQQPIHDLMRDAGVTIFFQGHDHLYARQELEGVVYQTCPNPADPTFTAFNREAYKSGQIFPNSGHLRVTLSDGSHPECKVEYIRSLRPSDEKDGLTNASIVHSYTIPPRSPAKSTTRPEGSR